MRHPARLLASLALGLVFALLPLARTEAADDWGLDNYTKRPSAWAGHGIGSSVTETTVIPIPKMPNMPNMPQMPGFKDGKMVTTKKSTLTKITKDEFVITVETTSMGRTTKRTEKEPRVRKTKVTFTDGGKGTVKVAGTEYACAIKIAANMGEVMGDKVPESPRGRGRGRAGAKPVIGAGKVFVHPKLGVLRMETTMTVMGQPGKMVWQVNRLAVPKKVGETTYTCREAVITTTTSMGAGTITMLIHPRIPGGALQTIVKSKIRGHDMTITTNTTSYVKKPLVVTTAPKSSGTK